MPSEEPLYRLIEDKLVIPAPTCDDSATDQAIKERLEEARKKIISTRKNGGSLSRMIAGAPSPINTLALVYNTDGIDDIFDLRKYRDSRDLGKGQTAILCDHERDFAGFKIYSSNKWEFAVVEFEGPHTLFDPQDSMPTYGTVYGFNVLHGLATKDFPNNNIVFAVSEVPDDIHNTYDLDAKTHAAITWPVFKARGSKKRYLHSPRGIPTHYVARPETDARNYHMPIEINCDHFTLPDCLSEKRK